MRLWELFLIALGLSMDAFVVSVCKGLSLKRPRWAHSLSCGAYFGGFQCLMPVVGWLFGIRFQRLLFNWAPLAAFALLSFLGVKMMLDARCNQGDHSASIAWPVMLPLALATSIDALALGVSLAFLQVELFPAAPIIGATTFVLCAFGVQLGAVAGTFLQGKAELAGGLVLLAMAVRVLLSHYL